MKIDDACHPQKRQSIVKRMKSFFFPLNLKFLYHNKLENALYYAFKMLWEKREIECGNSFVKKVDTAKSSHIPFREIAKKKKCLFDVMNVIHKCHLH